MFKKGDRVVHGDSEWYEYETVDRLTGSGYWVHTNEGTQDFADNFRLYEPREMKVAEVYLRYADASSETLYILVSSEVTESSLMDIVVHGFKGGFLRFVQVNPDEISDRRQTVINPDQLRVVVFLRFLDV